MLSSPPPAGKITKIIALHFCNCYNRLLYCILYFILRQYNTILPDKKSTAHFYVMTQLAERESGQRHPTGAK